MPSECLAIGWNTCKSQVCYMKKQQGRPEDKGLAPTGHLHVQGRGCWQTALPNCPVLVHEGSKGLPATSTGALEVCHVYHRIVLDQLSEAWHKTLRLIVSFVCRLASRPHKQGSHLSSARVHACDHKTQRSLHRITHLHMACSSRNTQG